MVSSQNNAQVNDSSCFKSDLRTTYIIFRPRVLLHPIIVSTTSHLIIISQLNSQQVELLPVHDTSQKQNEIDGMKQLPTGLKGSNDLGIPVF